MGDIMEIIRYFSEMGRSMAVVFGLLLCFFGITDAIIEKRLKPILATIVGGIIVVLEILVPIAAINTVIAGLVLLIFALIFVIAICS